MEEDTVVGLPRPSGTVDDDPLLCVLRDGARQMLMQAIEAEGTAFFCGPRRSGRRARTSPPGPPRSRARARHPDRDRRHRGPTAAGARPWCRRRVPYPLHLGGAASLSAPGQEHRRALALAVPQTMSGRRRGCARPAASGSRRREPARRGSPTCRRSDRPDGRRRTSLLDLLVSRGRPRRAQSAASWHGLRRRPTRARARGAARPSALDRGLSPAANRAGWCSQDRLTSEKLRDRHQAVELAKGTGKAGKEPRSHRASHPLGQRSQMQAYEARRLVRCSRTRERTRA
jgi:hypothetical protein